MYRQRQKDLSIQTNQNNPQNQTNHFYLYVRSPKETRSKTFKFDLLSGPMLSATYIH